MATNKSDLIRLLEAELDFIEGGGYSSPAGQPWVERPVFYHTPSCINHWLVPYHKEDCHDDCVLMEAVPPEHRSQNLPCHHIPLNKAGDTVKSLEARGDREQLVNDVTEWLRSTIQRLKEGEDVLGVSDVKY